MRRNASILLTVLLASFAISVFNGALADVRASPDLPSDMPVLFVDPVDIVVAPGDNLTISVVMFNLTDSCLFGFGIILNWDPTILNYTSHIVTIPVETYPDGILHGPVIAIANTVNATGGTYEIAQSSMFPAAPFNRTDGNSTIFNMTFNAITFGMCTLNFTLHDFADNTASSIQHTVYTSDVTVIPEFPSVVILPLLISATLLVALIRRKKHLVKTI